MLLCGCVCAKAGRGGWQASTRRRVLQPAHRAQRASTRRRRVHQRVRRAPRASTRRRRVLQPARLAQQASTRRRRALFPIQPARRAPQDRFRRLVVCQSALTVRLRSFPSSKAQILPHLARAARLANIRPQLDLPHQLTASVAKLGLIQSIKALLHVWIASWASILIWQAPPPVVSALIMAFASLAKRERRCWHQSPWLQIFQSARHVLSDTPHRLVCVNRVLKAHSRLPVYQSAPHVKTTQIPLRAALPANAKLGSHSKTVRA